MLAMTRDAARVAYSGRSVGCVVRCRRWVAGQTGKDGLSQGTQRLGASIELLLERSARVDHVKRL
jgi:hypothetical protein